jgi:transcriptional regulator with XRE-family HTH domain
MIQETNKTHGSIIRGLRLQSNMTREQLADMSGLSYDQIRRLEENNKILTFQEAELLSETFTVCISTFKIKCKFKDRKKAN